MTDRRSNDLHYGHFGEAVYNGESKEWQFNRTISEKIVLRPLGSSKTFVPAPSRGSSFDQDHPRVSLKRQAQILARSHPDIDPAVSLLPALAEVSEAVTSLTLEYDPIISERFALGKALDCANGPPSSNAIPIAAMSGGANGDALKLVQIREDWYGWGSNRGVNLSVPEIDGGIEGWWTGDGGVLQQICFAEKAGTSTTWLAVRLPCATVILRPLLQSVSVPASSLEFGHYSKSYPSSPLDANPVLTLHIHRTGGISHANVTFNPWYERQFAIVDQQGFWSIWTIEDYRHRSGSAYAGAGKSAHVLDGASDDADSTARGQADGWGKLCWVADGSTLLVCSRRHLAIFDLKALKPARLQAPEVGLERSSDWILDVKRNPLDDGHVFVLTSSRIFWLDITGVEESIDNEHGVGGGRILLSLRHYREADDITLRLQLMPLDEEEMLVLIYSHLNKLVTTFHLSLSMELPSIPTVISDPYLFDVPKDFLGSSESLDSASISKGLQISALTVVPLEMKTNSRYEVGGLGSLYLDHDVRFFQLLVQLNDLSGRSCLYTSGGPKSGWQTESNELEEIVAPSLQVKDAGRAGKSATWVGEENLVVEDGIRESSETEHQSLGQRRLYEQRLARRSSASCDPEDDPWTVDSHLLYDLASGAGTPNIIRGVELAEKQSLGQYLDTLKTRLDRKVETAFSPVQSLLELSSNRPIIEGLNDESLYLDESLHTVLKETHTNESGSTLVTTNLVPTNFFGTPNRHQHEGSLEGSALVLSDVYKGLLKDWVTPLSDEVPGRTRIAKAKIAAQMAAELSFASIGVQLRPPVDPAPASQEEPATLALSTFNLPVHPQLQSPSSSGIGKGKQKQALPYPTPQPSSFDPPAILNSKRSGTAFVEDLASARLRFYTSLTPQPTLPPSLSSVLSRWTPGSDPANYTWAAPRVALAEPTLEERNIEAREISRQRKRRERLLKRQRADTLTASQPEPERPYGSQPTLAIRGLVSSQPTVEDHVPMSQAERGPHGGRLSTGKASRPIKKQKRPAGF